MSRNLSCSLIPAVSGAKNHPPNEFQYVPTFPSNILETNRSHTDHRWSQIAFGSNASLTHWKQSHWYLCTESLHGLRQTQLATLATQNEQPKDFSRSDFPGGPGTSRTRHRSQGTWETLQAPETVGKPACHPMTSRNTAGVIPVIFTLWFLTGSTQMSFPPSSHPIDLLKTSGGPSFQYEVDWYSTLHWHGNSPEVQKCYTISNLEKLKCTLIYMCINIYIYIHTYTYVYIHMCMCIYIYIYIYMHTCMYICVCIYVCMSKCMYVCMYVCM